MLSYHHQVDKYFKAFLDLFPTGKTKFHIKGAIAFKHNCFRGADFSDTFLAIARKIKLEVTTSENFIPYNINEFQINFRKDKLTFFHIKQPLRISEDICIYTNMTNNTCDKNE
jgi:hypothetical protein